MIYFHHKLRGCAPKRLFSEMTGSHSLNTKARAITQYGYNTLFQIWYNTVEETNSL